MKMNSIHKSHKPDFQLAFEDALKAYRSLPWYKRLFGVSFVTFDQTHDGQFITKWSEK